MCRSTWTAKKLSEFGIASNSLAFDRFQMWSLRPQTEQCHEIITISIQTTTHNNNHKCAGTIFAYCKTYKPFARARNRKLLIWRKNRIVSITLFVADFGVWLSKTRYEIREKRRKSRPKWCACQTTHSTICAICVNGAACVQRVSNMLRTCAWEKHRLRHRSHRRSCELSS